MDKFIYNIIKMYTVKQKNAYEQKLKENWIFLLHCEKK